MPFKPGHTLSKGKGRPVGSKDSRSRYYDVMALLESESHDPVMALITLAKDPNADPELRFKANKELVSKVAPQLKAIEHKGDTEMASDVAELKAELKAQAEKYKRDH